jgi:hypothetical protein
MVEEALANGNSALPTSSARAFNAVAECHV